MTGRGNGNGSFGTILRLAGSNVGDSALLTKPDPACLVNDPGKTFLVHSPLYESSFMLLGVMRPCPIVELLEFCFYLATLSRTFSLGTLGLDEVKVRRVRHLDDFGESLRGILDSV